MKKERERVRTIKSKWWYYKGSDIIGEGRKEEEQKRVGSE